jgi:hypothetical protein
MFPNIHVFINKSYKFYWVNPQITLKNGETNETSLPKKEFRQRNSILHMSRVKKSLYRIVPRSFLYMKVH